jgi:hypothetical protein
VTPDELTELYTTFERTAWRLEARDDYAVPGDDEDFDAFLAGRPVPPRTVENSWWLRTVADATCAGKRFRRVRLLSHPVTDYTRFELASYPENITAGEAVRILELPRRHSSRGSPSLRGDPSPRREPFRAVRGVRPTLIGARRIVGARPKEDARP